MAGTDIQLVAGLGNPGKEYAQTRHNAGFWLVDELARRHGGSWRREPRFDAELSRVRVAGTELWLVKPQAYMNRSGGVTAGVANFYKIPAASMLVVHDELDLLPGVVRLKQGGGSGGHNGLKDLIAHLGEDFWRLRLGIGHPGSRDLVTDFVLGRASAAEQQLLDDGTYAGADCLPRVLEQGAQQVMKSLHSADGKQKV
ncbi:MAG: aminoacyl-tRNA hydrolase [Proteobacteria bacterium]|nr:aminoacyl-tRNA hydrolase [Pseudomonadota bacterium]